MALLASSDSRWPPVQQGADGFVSEDDESDDSHITFDSPLSLLPDRLTISLSVRAAYTNWQPRAAFRELIQNWRDGIISSFALPEHDFTVECERKAVSGGTEIIYKVPRPRSNPKEWLGFVHFKPRGLAGIVEITNRNASLDTSNLDIGGTTKIGAGNLAGAHGEGLKLALLVLMRGSQNHKVRCRSGGFTWTFNFGKNGRLVARLSRISEQAHSRLELQTRTKAGKSLLPFCPSAKNDVQFLLGEPHKGRSELGVPVQRRMVTQDNFESWCESALFLQNPDPNEIVRTRDGDLLIGEKFRGRLYLKGLLLNEDTESRWASVTNKPLRYGYNFAYGTTNRERQSVAGAYEESATILNIWSTAITEKPELVSELSFMLNSKQTRYADIDGAMARVGKRTAEALWTYLTNDPYQKRWYYSAKEKSDCPRLDDIIHGLGYEGFELSQLHWDVLRQRDLVRTADEQQRRRFLGAVPLSTLSDSFTTLVYLRLLTAVRGCELTKGTTIRFVKAGALDLQNLYVEDEKSFLIHERAVSREGAADILGLPCEMITRDLAFHTVVKLFTDLVELLPAGLFLTGNANKSIEWQRKSHVRLLEQRFLDHLRLELIKISVNYQTGTVSTEWPQHYWPLGTAIEIQYHSISCGRELQKRILVAADATSSTMPCLSDDILPRTSEDAGGRTGTTTCRVLKTKNSETNHHSVRITGNQDIMQLTFLPADAGSFVVWRYERKPLATRPTPKPLATQHTPIPGRVSDAAYSTVDSSAVLFNELPVPAEPDDDVVEVSAPQVASYAVGQRLSEFNIIPVYEWYEAVGANTTDARAVIGLLRQGADGTQALKRKQSVSAEDQARASRARTSLTVPLSSAVRQG